MILVAVIVVCGAPSCLKLRAAFPNTNKFDSPDNIKPDDQIQNSLKAQIQIQNNLTLSGARGGGEKHPPSHTFVIPRKKINEKNCQSI